MQKLLAALPLWALRPPGCAGVPTLACESWGMVCTVPKATFPATHTHEVLGGGGAPECGPSEVGGNAEFRLPYGTCNVTRTFDFEGGFLTDAVTLVPRLGHGSIILASAPPAQYTFECSSPLFSVVSTFVEHQPATPPSSTATSYTATVTTTELPTPPPPRPLLSVAVSAELPEENFNDLVGDAAVLESLRELIRAEIARHFGIPIENVRVYFPNARRLQDTSIVRMGLQVYVEILEAPVQPPQREEVQINVTGLIASMVAQQAQVPPDQVVMNQTAVDVEFGTMTFTATTQAPRTDTSTTDTTTAHTTTATTTSTTGRVIVVGGRNQLAVAFQLYPNSSFVDPLGNAGTLVDPSRLFMELRASDASDIIGVDTCTASPTGMPDDEYRVDFLTSYCAQSPFDLQQHGGGAPNVARFSVRAFKFANAPLVYITCVVSRCAAAPCGQCDNGRRLPGGRSLPGGQWEPRRLAGASGFVAARLYIPPTGRVMRLAGPLQAGSKRRVWTNPSDPWHLDGHVLSGNVTLFGLHSDVELPRLVDIMPDVLAGALPGRAPEGIIIRFASTLQGQHVGESARTGGDDEAELVAVVFDFDIAGLRTRDLMEVQLQIEPMQASSAAAAALSAALGSRMELLGLGCPCDIQALFGATSFDNSGQPPGAQEHEAQQEHAAHQGRASCSLEVASACWDGPGAWVLLSVLVVLAVLSAALCVLAARALSTRACRKAPTGDAARPASHPPGAAGMCPARAVTVHRI